MSNLLVKVCCSEWINENRDIRELDVCMELGFNVIVVAKGNLRNNDYVCGFDVRRLSTRPLGKYFPSSINRVVALFTWAHYINRLRPNVISGHDITGLLVGWISTWFIPRSKAPKLIYDSHELEVGRNVKRSRLSTWCIARLEHFLIKRSVFSIVVNDEIAKEIQNMYELDKCPVVVRSMPSLWEIDMKEIHRIRDEWNTQLGIPSDSFFVMYHGAVMPGRGIENLIQLAGLNHHISVVILGNGSSSYIAVLKQMCQHLKVDARVIFHKAVDIKDLWKYVGAADIGFVLCEASSKSYYYCLPNKFFENIQSETPIICSNFPVMKPIVDKYQIGLTCDPNDVNAINDCIERMRTDKEFYEKCKANLKIAKRELCWENEKKTLISAYKKLL